MVQTDRSRGCKDITQDALEIRFSTRSPVHRGRSVACSTSIIYDQSPRHNDLTLTQGGWIGDRAHEADAAGIELSVGGQTVYGIHIPRSDGVTGVRYRNNQATGTAEDDEPESMYMVTSGTYYSALCCFDYGNAQRNSANSGNGTMEAIYFGAATFWGTGEGDGPWIMADLENGVYSAQSFEKNPNNLSFNVDYAAAMLKGKPGSFALKGGDAQSGTLTTMYGGPRPSAAGYDPARKEGAIVLGTGGDNSFTAMGDFFEGAITAGYSSDAVDDAIQANIIEAGYGR